MDLTTAIIVILMILLFLGSSRRLSIYSRMNKTAPGYRERAFGEKSCESADAKRT